MLNVQKEAPLNVAVIGATWLARRVAGSTSHAKVCPAFLLGRVLLLALPHSKMGAPVRLIVAGTWEVNVIVSAKSISKLLVDDCVDLRCNLFETFDVTTCCNKNFHSTHARFECVCLETYL